VIRTPGQADPWQVIADVMSELIRGGQTADIRCRAALGVFERAGIDFDGNPVAIAAREPQAAPDPDGQQRYIDQLHDLIRDMLTTYPGLATELPAFQDRAGQLYVHDHDGQPFSGSWADGDGPLIRPQPAPEMAVAMARVRRVLEDSPTASIARREALEIINAFGVER
jgi:hypothetical protein